MMASAEHTNVRGRVRLSIAAAVATLTVAMAGAVPRADGP
jgi:hypothetical protein